MLPQYHLVLNGLFKSLFCNDNGALLDDICIHLIDSICNYYFYDNKFIFHYPLVHTPPVFVPDQGYGATQPNGDDESIIQINATSTYLIMIWMMLLLSLIMSHLLIPTILMNLILNIYAKTCKFWDTNQITYVEPMKSPVPLYLGRFQYTLPDSLIRNSSANNDLAFRIWLVILC